MLKNFHSFKHIINNIVAERFRLSYSYHHNFLATMPRRDPVGAICQPLNSGSEADGRLEFILFVGGRQPQIDEVWYFGDDRINREVHPFARVDVGAFSRYCFGTDYLAENGRRVPIYSRKLIIGSVEWLGIPARATVRRIRDNLLREHRLARTQSILDSRNILCDEMVNQTGFALDDLWDKLVLQ